MTYESFIERLKELGASKPYMKRKQWNEMQGIENEPVLPSPIRTQTHDKLIEPTHENYEKIEVPRLIKTVKLPKKQVRPSVRKKPIQTEEERAIKRKEINARYYQKQVGREVKNRTYMKLTHMTPEQKREHRLKQQRESKRRNNGS